MSKNLNPRGSNSNSKGSNSRDLVTKAYNNPIIVKNEDGEYAPIGNNIFGIYIGSKVTFKANDAMI